MNNLLTDLNSTSLLMRMNLSPEIAGTFLLTT